MPDTVYPPRDWGRHPAALHPPYRSSRLRAPQQAPLALPASLSETTGPVFGHGDVGPGDDDLLTNAARPGQSAIGPRIIVHGRVTDQSGRPAAGALLEVWQANAGGRYRHRRDGYLAPLDPDFGGCGRVLTGADGTYSFRTVMPGPYPWPNGPNAWRPAHIHVSLFGHAFVQRLVTQMYFAGDPLIPLCSIVGALPDRAAVAALTAQLDMDRAVSMDALAWRFDIVLRGSRATPFEAA